LAYYQHLFDIDSMEVLERWCDMLSLIAASTCDVLG
jgi:hypothetical protein